MFSLNQPAPLFARDAVCVADTIKLEAGR
jgi:hypothetical protein